MRIPIKFPLLSVSLAAVAAAWAPGSAFAESRFKGTYAGAQLSLESSALDVKSAGLSADDLHISGINGGLHAGVNTVLGVRDGPILGLEGSFSVNGAEGSVTAPGDRVSIHSRYTYDLSGRLGYTPADETLLYGRLGWARTKFSGLEPGRRTHLDGVRFGGGVEQMIDADVSVRAEYTRTEYKDKRAGGRRFEPAQNLLTLGVSRHF